MRILLLICAFCAILSSVICIYQVETLLVRNGRIDNVFYYNGQLFFIDAHTRQLCCLHLSTGQTFCITAGAGTISFAVPMHGQHDKFALGYNHNNEKKIVYVTWNTQENAHPSLKEFNNVDQVVQGDTIIDGTVDPQGVLWLWTVNMHGQLGTGVYSYNPYMSRNLEVKNHLFEGNDLSNGILWCPRDPSKLYYINAHTQKILLYHYDRQTRLVTGPHRVVFDLQVWALLRKHELHQFHAHIGHATIDNRGILWVPVFGRPEVLEVDPNRARVTRVIVIKALRLAACAFGGAAMNILYVSSFGYGYDDHRDRRPNNDASGAIFAVSDLGPGIHGYQARPFVFPRFLFN